MPLNGLELLPLPPLAPSITYQSEAEQVVPQSVKINKQVKILFFIEVLL
jgi:hypothetical protein